MNALEDFELLDADDQKFEIPNQPSKDPAIYQVFGFLPSGAIQRVDVKAHTGDEAARVAMHAKKASWVRVAHVGTCRAVPAVEVAAKPVKVTKKAFDALVPAVSGLGSVLTELDQLQADEVIT